jgi:addiction module RelB/DinJ family antitoxin
MRRTEVYQVRLDMHEKKQAFAVFKQLGISPAQAIRLFFRQVVMTRSIPFPIEHGHLESAEHDSNHKKDKKIEPSQVIDNSNDKLQDLSDKDVFDQLDELLKNSSNPE